MSSLHIKELFLKHSGSRSLCVFSSVCLFVHVFFGFSVSLLAYAPDCLLDPLLVCLFVSVLWTICRLTAFDYLDSIHFLADVHELVEMGFTDVVNRGVIAGRVPLHSVLVGVRSLPHAL